MRKKSFTSDLLLTFSREEFSIQLVEFFLRDFVLSVGMNKKTLWLKMFLLTRKKSVLRIWDFLQLFSIAFFANNVQKNEALLIRFHFFPIIWYL